MSAREVVEALAARGLTVATAESLTGGLIVGALTAVPGASAVVRGGVVAYATDVKVSVLGVDGALVARVGAVDADVAAQMAVGVAALLGADLAVACTGVAGPDAHDGHGPGEVYVAVWSQGESAVERLDLEGTRDQVRAATVDRALAMLLQRAVALGERP